MMTVNFRFAIVLVLLVGDKWMTGVNCREFRKLFISIYYEANDPASQHFILQQLQPAMRLLHKHIVLRFVPFGRSESIREGLASFECEHGYYECISNIVQDCTLRSMTERSDMDKLAYVVCEMTTDAASREDLECVQKAGLSPDVIRHCSMAQEGIQMQLSSEYLTSLLSPGVIPTVTVDAVFDQEIQDNARVDLTGTLCTLLEDSALCAQYYNDMAMDHVLHYPTTKH